MSEEDIEQYLEENKQQYEECDCKGTASKPELYCDFCQEYRDVLELTMSD